MPGLGWQVDDYDAIKRVLADPRLSARTPQQMLVALGVSAPRFERSLFSWFLYQDPPDHTRLRRLVQSAFSQRVLATWLPQIEANAFELAAGLPGGSFDLLHAFCTPFASAGIGRLLGTSAALDSTLETATAAVLHALGNPSAENFAAAETALDQIEQAAVEAAAEGNEGLLRELASAEQERLHPDEFGPMASLLLAAGQETTRDLLANAFVRVLDDRLLWSKLGEASTTDDEVAAIVEELVRVDPSVRIAARVALEDVELEGEAVAAGEMIWLDLEACGKRAPDRPVLSFGHGMHFCLGASLARRELRVALRVMAQSQPGMVLTERPEAIAYRPSFIYRGRAAVPVAI